jgi:predicted transglutaminase-like cysteine proteinase
MPTKIRKHSCAETNVAFGPLLLAVTAVFFQLGLSTEAQARDPGRSQQPLSVGSPTQPTRAWTEFCTKLPAECMVDPSEPSTVDLTPSMLRKIIQVNRGVNKAILALPDRQHWGIEDRWDYPTDGVGDCEDIQLVKRKRLIDAGLPRRALRMTVVIDEAGNGHAVLMVRTTKGEFILDNKRDAVLPWHRTGYVYVMREADESAAWVSLGRRKSPVMTATR